MTESGLRIRVETQLRQEFMDACRAQDLTASQAIRGFMRRFIELHSNDGKVASTQLEERLSKAE